MLEHIETIAAISTPTGRAGIGAIRVSGKNSKKIYQALLRIVKKDMIMRQEFL